MKHLNPDSHEVSEAMDQNVVNVGKLHEILEETMEFVDRHTLTKYHCKCNNYYDFESDKVNRRSRSAKYQQRAEADGGLDNECSNILSQSTKNLLGINSDRYLHRPSDEFLIHCVDLFQQLFDVQCFASVPTKMNELYYRHGQLVNFRKAVQNVFDPSIFT
jgi:hypothetical protein